MSFNHHGVPDNLNDPVRSGVHVAACDDLLAPLRDVTELLVGHREPGCAVPVRALTDMAVPHDFGPSFRKPAHFSMQP